MWAIKLLKHLVGLTFIVSLLLNCSKDEEANESKTFARQPEGNRMLKSIIFEPLSDHSNKKDFEYENGRTKRTILWANNEVFEIGEYEYKVDDVLGKITYSNKNDHNDSQLELSHEEVFEYNTTEHFTKVTTNFYASGQSNYWLLFYNTEGLLTKEESYEAPDQLQSYKLFFYDEFGNIFEEKHYNSNHTLAFETHHFYKNNLLVKSMVYIANDERVPLRQILKHYDQDYNLINLKSEELWIGSSRSGYSENYEYY